jgi:hypothetical protein
MKDINDPVHLKAQIEALNYLSEKAVERSKKALILIASIATFLILIAVTAE